ncbi:CRISPR-associated endonuclease Cas1 [Nautilia lithotrophica]
MEDLFSVENLKSAAKEIGKPEDYFEFVNDEENFINLHNQLISGSYVPEPLIKIELKQKDKTRPIKLSLTKDKIVQRIISKFLTQLYDKTFSNKSYAYRPNRSALRAVNRVSDFINRGYTHVLKTDIEDFFENIDHDLLVKILKEKIKNEILIKYIIFFLKIGSFDTKNNFIEHTAGVDQGSVVSPILSNIYIDMMDKFLERHNIDFVRFADDFVVFAKSKKKAEFILRNLKRFLKLLKLSLNEEKTYITHINNGFTFLGVYFRGKYRTLDNERFEKIKQKLFSYAKENNSFENIDRYFTLISNYYLQIVKNNTAAKEEIKNLLIDSLVKAVIGQKENLKKSEIKEVLTNMKALDVFVSKSRVVDIILKRAYNLQKSVKSALNVQRSRYARKVVLSGLIHISGYGMSLGVSKNRFTLKKYGKVIKYFPVNKIKRIIVESEGFSISSNVLYKVSNLNISIDFIDKKSNPYASVTFYNASVHQLIHKQATILNTPKHLDIAKKFVYAKLKNQKNFLIYMNKYHKETDKEIKTIKEIIKNTNKAASINELMGYEGSAAAAYWNAVGKLIDKEGFERITKGAGDEVNSALNYAYAILYGKIQHALITAGLSLHISYLHSLENTKPTLVFDFMELFRSYVVDRTIVAMINKNEHIKVVKGALDDESRKNISKNIHERLATFTEYKNKSMQIENIIYSQAYEFRNHILENKPFRPFIGRY